MGRGVCRRGHFSDRGERGFCTCGRPDFLVQKASDFLKFMMRPHGQGGVEPMGVGSGGAEGAMASPGFSYMVQI